MDDAEFAANVRAWRSKQRRTQARFAMLALVAAKCAGNKESTLEDFMGAWGEEDSDV